MLSAAFEPGETLPESRRDCAYRECTLTRVVQPCLGGDSKCLMFVNVSPAKTHVQVHV